LGGKKTTKKGIMAKKRNFSVIEFPCLEGGRNYFFKPKKKNCENRNRLKKLDFLERDFYKILLSKFSKENQIVCDN